MKQKQLFFLFLLNANQSLDNNLGDYTFYLIRGILCPLVTILMN